MLKLLIKPIQPMMLVSLLATYALGAGLVQYVERMDDWTSFVIGGILLLLWVLAFEYLEMMVVLRDRSRWPEGMDAQTIRQVRWALAILAATFLTLGATMVINWMLNGLLWQGLILLLLTVVICLVLRYLAASVAFLIPYRLIFEVLLVIVLPPAVAFFLQSQDHHQLLTLSVMGLLPLYLAYRLLGELQAFGQKGQSDGQTLVSRIGWARVMVLHNALTLTGYLLMALSGLLGFPWFLLWPVFLALPIGLLEVWLMERVRRGSKPVWGVMRFASGAALLFPIYLMGFAFWIR